MSDVPRSMSGERFVDPGVAAVAIAVLRGARSLREVVDATGMQRGSAYDRLRRAARQGLVDWEPDRLHTLRSTLGVAASDLGRRQHRRKYPG